MCEGQRAAQVELSEFMGDIKLAALHEAVTLLYGTDVGRKPSASGSYNYSKRMDY